jgi:hypothetical protein
MLTNSPKQKSLRFHFTLLTSTCTARDGPLSSRVGEPSGPLDLAALEGFGGPIRDAETRPPIADVVWVQS